jgi:hypothetical protein
LTCPTAAAGSAADLVATLVREPVVTGRPVRSSRVLAGEARKPAQSVEGRSIAAAPTSASQATNPGRLRSGRPD